MAQGDRVVPILNRYINLFEEKEASIILTRDWHPENHSSFIPKGGPWPIHCVQNMEGARFHKDLYCPEKVKIISKGYDINIDAYSGFQGTDLKDYLNNLKVETVFVGGLATDYCVKSTVLDAVELGFTTVFIQDGSRAVNLNPGDGTRAWEEMKKAGALLTDLSEIKEGHDGG